jgi:hypothetical protein
MSDRAPVDYVNTLGIPGPDGTEVRVPARTAPLWWMKQGLSFTRDGYGRRTPTSRMVQLPGSPRWRRVYVCIYSNSGTAYVEDRKNLRANGRPSRIVISD